MHGEAGPSRSKLQPPWTFHALGALGPSRQPRSSTIGRRWGSARRCSKRLRQIWVSSTIKRSCLAGRPWVAVHTPGHTADHLCLYDAEEGLMITGDHVLPTITPHISGFAADQAPLTRFLDSLNRMHDFADVRLAMPAHGNPFTDLTGRAEHISEHHLERLDAIRKAADELEGGSVDEYMKRTFSERSWGDMAASETYAHLDHLRDHGELQATWHDGLLRFSHSAESVTRGKENIGLIV